VNIDETRSNHLTGGVHDLGPLRRLDAFFEGRNFAVLEKQIHALVQTLRRVDDPAVTNENLAHFVLPREDREWPFGWPHRW